LEKEKEFNPSAKPVVSIEKDKKLLYYCLLSSFSNRIKEET